MTENQLRKRMIYWKAKLDLHGWEFEVSTVPEPQGRAGSLAAVICSEHYDSARFEFRDGWKDADPDELEVLIVHELLHVRRRDYYLAQHIPCEFLSKDVESLYHDALEHEDEKDIMWLARFIVAQDRS